VAITFGENGRVVDQISRTDTVTVKKEAHKRILDYGLLYGLALPVNKPGAYQLRVAVRDGASSRVGSANQFVAVPDLTKGLLTLSGMVLSGKHPAGEKAPSAAVQGGTNSGDTQAGSSQASGAQPAPSQPASNQTGSNQTPRTSGSNDSAPASGHVDPNNVEGAQVGDSVEKTGPELRLFRRGKDLDLEYSVRIYNAHVDKSTGQPQLESQMRLFKDGTAVYVSPLAPMKLSPAHHDDWKRISIAGTMRLTHSQEPGHYVLQMVVVDKLAKEKYRTATQWMDFEVVE
jgi:hypothetical protein